MIELRVGDIFKQEDLDVIIHQANCFNTMKSGIAKDIAELYPEAVEADNRTIKGDKSKLGSYTCGVGKNDMHIINMYSQYHFYPRTVVHTDYEAMERAFKTIKEDYVSPSPPITIGIPLGIGCGLAGGDWNKVWEIIKKIFADDINYNIVICKKQ